MSIKYKMFKHSIGFISYTIFNSIIKLKIVWVNRDSRGKGLGTKMFQDFLKTLTSPMLIEGDVWFDKTLNFYRRLGFEIYETREEDIYKIKKYL